VKQASLYGIVILVGAAAVALFGTGIATFVWGEGLRSQKAVSVGIPELESINGDIKEFQLVAKEPEVNLECRPDQMSEREQSLPDFEVILVNELPDPHAPQLVSFSGCPLANRCSYRAAETY
jgi:hypothetical protein